MIKTVTSQQLRHNPADITISNKTTGEYGALVPNDDLKAMEAKMKAKKAWDDDVCYHDYVTAYMRQLRGTECRTALNSLYKESKAGKTVVFANHNMGNEHSWSNVLLGLMQGAKADCKSEVSYAHYYTTYKLTPKA